MSHANVDYPEAPTGPPPPKRATKFATKTYRRAVAKSTDLDRAEKAVLQAILTYSDRKGHSRPGQETLKVETGYSVRHVSRVTKQLEAKGWLRIDRPADLDKAGRPKHYVKGSAEGVALRYWLLYPGDDPGVERCALAVLSPTPERRCQHIRENGNRCRAWAMRGGSWCRHHVLIHRDTDVGIDTDITSVEEVITSRGLKPLEEVIVLDQSRPTDGMSAPLAAAPTTFQSSNVRHGLTGVGLAPTPVHSSSVRDSNVGLIVCDNERKWAEENLAEIAWEAESEREALDLALGEVSRPLPEHGWIHPWEFQPEEAVAGWLEECGLTALALEDERTGVYEALSMLSWFGGRTGSDERDRYAAAF